MCCFDPGLAAQLNEIFLEDVGGCARVTLKDWQRRGLRVRSQELVASFLQEQA